MSGASCPRTTWSARRRESGSIGTSNAPGDRRGAVSAPRSSESPGRNAGDVDAVEAERRDADRVDPAVDPVGHLRLCRHPAGAHLSELHESGAHPGAGQNRIQGRRRPDSQAAIRTALEKHLNIESVDFPDVKDIKITRNGKAWVVDAAYDDQAPLFSNVFILVSFDKTVTIGSEGGD